MTTLGKVLPTFGAPDAYTFGSISYISAVPESGTAAQMLLGLTLLMLALPRTYRQLRASTASWTTRSPSNSGTFA